MFSGQLSTMYLFSEALSSAQVASIYELGPSYKVGLESYWEKCCRKVIFVHEMPGCWRSLLMLLLTMCGMYSVRHCQVHRWPL